VRFPVVLFDLDGTLIDSGSIILASFRHATRSVLGREFPDRELVASAPGSTLEVQMSAFDPDRVDELVAAYRAHNTPLHDELECCLGMEDVLRELKAQGRRLGVVTAKRRMTVGLAFKRLGIEPWFDVVVTCDDTTAHKPDPEPIELALARLAAKPEDAAYVGDSPFDVAAARGAGVFAVAVTWGGMHDVDDADAIVDTAEELLGVL
jgi:pyrophosphatase PpaX